MATPHYKLIYFNVRARGEPIRLILAAAGQSYEDYRIEKEQWPALKETTPWGKVPILEVDGQRLSESSAICRYLARKFNLVGSNDFEAARCDEFVDAVMDYRSHWKVFYFESEPTKKAALKKDFLETHTPNYLPKFEKILRESSGDFLLGKVYTWADLHIAHSFLFLEETVDKDILAPYPNCKKFKDAVFNIPQIKKWVDERPSNLM